MADERRRAAVPPPPLPRSATSLPVAGDGSVRPRVSTSSETQIDLTKKPKSLASEDRPPTPPSVTPPKPSSDPIAEAGVPEATEEPDHAPLRPASRPPASIGTPSRGVAAALTNVCPKCGERYPPDFKVCPRDAAVLEQLPAIEQQDPLIGTTLAETYRITRVIGHGGMGRVYEAKHTRLGNKRFAIKLLHQEYARHAEIVTRFHREADAASGIQHPNVLEVYDVHRTKDGTPYIVGEFLEGEELGSLLDRIGKLDPAFFLPIMRQVCHALQAAHERGVVHRDMKPENVFLIGDQQVPTAKVLDFGISKIADDSTTSKNLTRTGVIMGTPSYMSPEQARGTKVDHRTDVYAVGAILYRGLTGKRAFDFEDPTVTIAAVLMDEPPRPRSINSDISPALELVIQHAMAKRAEDRYASMNELEADLAQFDVSSAQNLPVSLPSADLSPPNLGERVRELTGVPGSTTRLLSSADAITRAAREARLARPTIVAMTAVAYAWVVGLIVDTIATSMTIARLGTDTIPTTTEALLVIVGTIVASITPLVLWSRRVGRKIWGNSVRALELAYTMRRVVGIGIAGYGFAELELRIVAAANPGVIADPRAELLAVGASVLAAAYVWLRIALERRRLDKR